MAGHSISSVWERRRTLCMCICCMSSCPGAAEPAMLGIAPGIMAGCIPEAAIIICAETLLSLPIRVLQQQRRPQPQPRKLSS